MNHVDPAGTGTVILGCSCNCLRLPPQEKMLGYECSHMYDPQMMESVLGDLYLHFHRILDPLNQGQPVTRQRLWGIMLKKSSLAEWSFGMSLKGGWPHSRMDIMLSRLLSLFNRKCEVPFHAFLLATEDEIMWDCEWMRSRPHRPRIGLRPQQKSLRMRAPPAKMARRMFLTDLFRGFDCVLDS